MYVKIYAGFITKSTLPNFIVLPFSVIWSYGPDLPTALRARWLWKEMLSWVSFYQTSLRGPKSPISYTFNFACRISRQIGALE